VTSNFFSPEVVIRPALPLDKADVFEFTKFTWDGEDYIKYVWDWWFSDLHGGLFVAEYAGRAIGMGKLTRISSGNWWMQGLRVDPRFQNKAIGSLLNDFLVQDWLERGEGTVRFLTSAEKVKVHRMAERNGFVRVGDRARFRLGISNATPSDGEQPFVPITETEIPEAVEIARQTELALLGLGLADLGWRYSEINVEAFLEIMNDDDCFAYLWRGRQGVLLGWEDVTHDDSHEHHYGIALVACSSSEAADFFGDLCKLGAQNEKVSIHWYPFLHPELINILTAVGFEQVGENVNYLFEKRHPTRP